MKCDADRINLYIDGMLPKSEERALLSHVEECGECASLLSFLRAYKEGLHGINEVAPPPGLLKDAIARAAVHPRKRRVNWRAWGSAVAAVAVLCIGVALMLDSGMLGAKSAAPESAKAGVYDAAAGAAYEEASYDQSAELAVAEEAPAEAAPEAAPAEPEAPVPEPAATSSPEEPRSEDVAVDGGTESSGVTKESGARQLSVTLSAAEFDTLIDLIAQVDGEEAAQEARDTHSYLVSAEALEGGLQEFLNKIDAGCVAVVGDGMTFNVQ